MSEARVSYRALGKQSGTTDAVSVGLGAPITLWAFGSPARQVSGLTLEFNGRPGVPVRFALYEVRGRRLADMDLVPDAGGVIRTRWPSMHPLPRGLYFVRASQGDASTVARIVLAGGGTP